MNESMANTKSPTSAHESQSTGSLALSLLLIASLGCNLFLGWQLRHAKAIPVVADSSTTTAILGTKLSSLDIAGLDGTPVRLTMSSPKPTVLYVLSPQCRWCARNSSNITSLARFAGEKYRFIGLSLNDGNLQKWVQAHSLGFPIYAISSYSVAPALKLGGTPEMIVVSPDGTVLKAWMGALTGDDLKAVEAYFGVKLPGPTAESEVGTSKLPTETVQLPLHAENK